jgi:alpha-L-fucosidase 2
MNMALMVVVAMAAPIWVRAAEIKLLPTLPDAWPSGHINGLRARGDYTVDIAWKGGKLESATMLAGKNAVSGKVPFVYNGISKMIDLALGKKVTVTKNQYE